MASWDAQFRRASASLALNRGTFGCSLIALALPVRAISNLLIYLIVSMLRCNLEAWMKYRFNPGSRPELGWSA